MNRFLNWWRDFWTSKEVALLKAENERLKDSNITLAEELAVQQKESRAAVNTLLERAGITPLPVREEPKPAAIPFQRRLSYHQQQRQHAWQTSQGKKVEDLAHGK